MRLPERIFSVLLLICLTAGQRSLKAQSISLEQVLASVDRYYEKLYSLKADFVQLVEVQALEKSDKFRGRFYYLKPHYLRLEYDEPRGQLMVADGTWYWFYMPQEDIPQAMRAPMEKGVSAPRYILGGRMAERFSGRLTGREQRGGAECYVLDLEPKESTYYKSLRAWVDVKTFSTRAVCYVDEGGQFNTFDLLNLKENVNIAPSKFNFSPPSGTQILDAE